MLLLRHVTGAKQSLLSRKMMGSGKRKRGKRRYKHTRSRKESGHISKLIRKSVETGGCAARLHMGGRHEEIREKGDETPEKKEGR